MDINITAVANADTILSFETWCQMRLSESPQFHFWQLVLSMELTILSWLEHPERPIYFVLPSVLIPFFFAYNNVNYVHWLPVLLRVMLSLEHKHPDVSIEFQSGKFVVFKSSRTFSAMVIDTNRQMLLLKVKVIQLAWLRIHQH